MTNHVHSFASRTGGILLAAITLTSFAFAAPPANQKIDFNAQIRPIISGKCYACHGQDEHSRKAKLRLDLRDEAIRERDDVIPIKPGDAKNSEIIRRISLGEDSDDIMPPTKSGHPLTKAEIDLLKRWIDEGANYATHWSFTKPVLPALPKVSQKKWPKLPLDHFILAKLEANKLKPAAPADRHALIRRLSLDLTGLPPAPAEVEAFVADKSSDAYERLVDRLLASPAYGEKMARMWLDIARYADSYGYGQDSLRQNNPWPYRDWVIKAFNQNLPFDRFTIDQLAGDLLENPTEDQLIATAFHRNTMTNVEGGTDDEEWRVAAVRDRANVTAQAWMGLTMGCAQCHTHKFDPITHHEYYQFYAFFNQTEDNDQPDERPTMPYPTAAQRQRTQELKAQIAVLEKELSADKPEVTQELAAWEQRARANDVWKLTDVTEAKAAQGTELQKLDDLSLRVGTNDPAKDVYTIKFSSTLSNATGLRLEALPDDSLPAKGPGRSGGNFVINELTVSHQTDGAAKPARYVRIEIPGDERILSLAEVQVWQNQVNVATNGKASQSSVAYDGPAQRAIDGDTNGEFETAKSTTHTETQANPWWELDLGSETVIDSIVVWNRTDGDLESRLVNFKVRTLDASRNEVWETPVATAPRPSAELQPGQRVVRFRRATATYAQNDFEPAAMIDGKSDAKRGWAIGGGIGKQSAVFEFDAPMPPGEYTVRIIQNFGGEQTLGRFRLGLTDQALPLLAWPARVETLLSRTERTPEERAELTTWFRQYAKATTVLYAKIASLKKDLADIKPLQVPVLRELTAGKLRKTHLFNKGNFLDPGDEVFATTPAAFNQWPKGAPTNRLGLAQWLVSPENPLTARVIANRFWAQIFGVGLVETEEDFGTQGSLPSHPELLDWLAVELRDGGWNVKKFLKMLVMSATYQQTSRVTPEQLAKDPRNIWLGRAPRRRLDAENIRDQAMALSGLLSPKLGGPSVYPPQPAGLWRVAFDGARDYPTSMGEDRYRRGLYTVWRRTIPYPSMATFDAPSRETCTFRRLPTNTPLQAYVTLNDPVFMEAAQALGRRLMREGGATAEARIRYGLNLALARPADRAQVAALMELYESELAHYRSAKAEALKLATEPLGALPDGIDAAEAAAWTVVANVLLNLDGVLTKG